MASFDPFTFDPTAFMSGQMESKLWLVDKLYHVASTHNYISQWRDSKAFSVYIYAGWYGVTNLLLRAHSGFPRAFVTSFDADVQANQGALVLNEAFEYRGEFQVHTADVNKLVYSPGMGAEGWGRCDVLINTSVEHIEGKEWFENIPYGTLVALQSNNMEHLDEHVNTITSVEDLLADYPMQEVYYSGTLPFSYPTFSFNRFMIIGRK